MLEEVLKSINSNLERIAKALEAENVEVVAEAVHETAKQFRTTENTVVQTVTPVIPQIPAPVVQPVQNPEPVQQATAIPTTQIQESFTQEQLAVAMSNAVSAGKMNVIQGVLQQFNVQALTQINPADYNKVATMLKEAGVKI